MDWNPISTLASGVIGAVTGAVQNEKNRQFEREEAEKQRDWNAAQTDKQNQWNLEQWQREMDYNTPSAQMQRLKDAGLNPLYYGLDGNSTSGAPEAAQPLGYDRASVGNQVNPFAQGMESALQIAQISNIQSNTAKTNEETVSETVRREQMLLQNKNLKQELNNLMATEGLTNAQKSQIEKATGWIDRLNESVIAEQEANKNLSNAQKRRIDELLEGEKDIQIKTLKDFEERWEKLRQETKVLAQQEKLNQLDVDNYVLNHMSNGLIGSGISLQNLIRGLIEGFKDRQSIPMPDRETNSSPFYTPDYSMPQN